MRYVLFVFLLFFISCNQEDKKVTPRFIELITTNDSIFVFAKSNNDVPIFLKVKDVQTNKNSYINFKNKGSKLVLKFSLQELDSTKIFEKYDFSMFYGVSDLKRYDTLYNYNLPFLKGKRYRILQGNNGRFSHNKANSRFAIDFTMKIGQEVCAIREGYVVMTKSDSNEGGRSRDYLSKANKTFVYHKDGTFAQYAHFKQNGVLVKAGDSIEKGQLIGYSGNTGFSSQPHLHFVVYKPTTNGLVSVPFILDSIPSKRYTKGKIAHNK